MCAAAEVSSQNSFSLKVATWNVHRWQDAKIRSNVDRVSMALQKNAADVIGLQEMTGGERRLASFLEYESVCTGRGVGIFSRYPIRGSFVHLLDGPVDDSKSLTVELVHALQSNDVRLLHPRAISALIEHPHCGLFLFVCAYLHHHTEPKRMKQLRNLFEALSAMPAYSIVCVGDFNALNPSDYSGGELEAIVKRREENDWELPQRDVVDAITQFRWVDCRSLCTRQLGPLGTCRFNTRIDYVWANAAFLDRWNPVQMDHDWCDRASDHALVSCEYQPCSAVALDEDSVHVQEIEASSCHEKVD